MSSTLRRTVLWLVALAFILAGPTLRTQAAAEKKDILVNVHDLAGNAPLSGIKVTLRSGNSEGDGYTSDDGSTHIKISAANSNYASLSASSEGLCPINMSWQGNNGSISFPDHIDLVMEHSASISGTIVDENGKPLPGASVICRVAKKYPNPLEQLSSNGRPMIADSDGKWSLADVPEAFDSVSIGAYHKDCIDGQQYINPKPFSDIPGLKNGTATYKLHRGTPVTFIIHGPEGQPVRIARVAFGAFGAGSNSYPDEKADGDGKVELGIAPGTHEDFAITAKGFAPELIRETIGNTSKTFNINLPAGNLLEGTVLDASGDPIAEANISIQSWRGQNNLLQPRIRTDSDGKFSWTEAPADDLIVSVYSELGQKDNVTVRAGKENKIQLTPPASFKGTVVDAATNQPVTDYKTIYGMKWDLNQSINWQYNSGGEFEVSQDGNTFQATFRQNYPWLAVRVTADGYLPTDSTPFAPDGKDAAFTFKLEKGTPIKGTVLNADGTPLKGATVLLAAAGINLQIQNGTLEEWNLRQTQHAISAADGSFTLPAQRDAYLLAVISDAGYAQLSKADFVKDPTIKINPWGKIEGSVRRGTKPDAGAVVSGGGNNSYQQNQPNIMWNYNVVADSNGHFSISRVNASSFMIGRQLQLGNNSTTATDYVSVTPKPGETTTIQIGGVGRPVTGHIAIPPDLAAKGVNFYQAYVRQTSTKTPWQPPAEVMAMNETDRAAWYKKFLESPEGKKVIEDQRLDAQSQHNSAFLPKSDGTFRVDDVPPGQYTLTVILADPAAANQWQPGAALGTASINFTVPEVPNGVSDDPLDIGAVPVSITAAAGAHAPDITIKTLNNADWKLSDQKGKVVLLYFWSAVYSPSTDSLPALKDVWDTFGKNPKFTMIGISMADNTGDPTKKYAAANAITWPIAALGRDRQSLIQQYPMQQIPTYWLIDPNGTIVGQNLAKDTLKKQIDDTLKTAP